MAVTQQIPRNVSTAVAGATVFPYDFKINVEADLLLQVDGATKVLGVDYTLSGVGNDSGGNITLLVPLIGGESVMRKRLMAYARSTDFQNLGDLRSATLNNDQDAPVMMAQQLAEEVGRAIRVAPGTAVDFNAELAGPLTPLGAVVLKADGTGLAVGSTTLTGDMLLRGELFDPSSGKGAALSRWQQPAAGAVAQTVFVELARTVRPEQFDGVGDGVADDTAAMNAAIAYLNTIGWDRPLFLGSKKWLVTSPLTIITAPRSPTIIGQGAQVLVGHATGDVFTFYSGSGGPQIQNASVHGVEFDATAGLRTAGAAVRGLDVADMRVSSCTFRNQWEGIKFGVYQYPTVHDCTFLETQRGINFDQGSGGTVSNVRMQSGTGTTPTAGTRGLQLTNASGVMVNNTDIVRMDVGIYGFPATGLAVQFLFLNNTLCDTCNFGMQLGTSAGGTVSSIFINNSWFSSCNENGISATNVKNIRLNNCEVIVNRRNGLQFLGCEQVRVTGGMIGWNNVNNAAAEGGLYASGVLGLSVSGVLFTNKTGWVSYGSVYNQNFGIILAGTASSDVSIDDNRMVDHVTGDVSFSVAPTGIVHARGNRTTRTNVIASAATLAGFEAMHEFHTITGTVTVQNVGLPAFDDQIIRLRTVDGCTIQDGFNFKLAGNFVGTANSVLTLIGVRGFGWVELSRGII